MPYPFTGPKMFCASPNFLSHPKNLTAFSASSKTFVPAQKPIILNANHLFVWHKKFGPAQNILGPVKGINEYKNKCHKDFLPLALALSIKNKRKMVSKTIFLIINYYAFAEWPK